MSYFKAVTRWRRAAAFALLLAALTAVAPAGASAASFGKRTLNFGMSGSDVTALQGDLTALGFTIKVTGSFDRQTIHEVRAFQRQYGLQVDGVAGPATFTQLRTLLRKLDGNHMTETAMAANGANGLIGTSTGTTTATTPTAVPTQAPADDSGGAGFVPPPSQGGPIVKATLVDGLAVPGPGTPQAIVNVIEAANQIAFLPYVYGGGHGTYVIKNGVTQLDSGYDCSGSVSFALHGGGMLADPLDSEQFTDYGQPGQGTWLTLYTNGVAPTGVAHVYINIAGLWFDTATQSANNGNDRWSTTRTSPARSYIPRHPTGW